MLVRAIKDVMQNEYGSVYGTILRVFPPIEKEEALKIFKEWAEDRTPPKFLTERELQEYYDTQDQYNADVWDQLAIEHFKSYKDALADYLKEYGIIMFDHLTSNEEHTLIEALRFIKENDYDAYCWINGLIRAFRGNISQINYLKSLQEEKKNPISNRRKRGR